MALTSRPVFIIGASRSGTSVLARILSDSGIFMGADLESNHESRSLQGVNRWLYMNAGAGFETPGHIDALTSDPFLRQAAARTILEHTLGRNSIAFWGWRNMFRKRGWWGFKDPRTTFTLPLWLDVFPEAKVIHILRNGVDVAVSLRARRRRVEERWASGDQPCAELVRQNRAVANCRVRNLEFGLDHWSEYAARAQSHVRDLHRRGLGRACEIRYENLTQHTESTLATLSDFLDHDVKVGELGQLAPRMAHVEKDVQEFAANIYTTRPVLERFGY